jgi:hypothetical protein
MTLLEPLCIPDHGYNLLRKSGFPETSSGQASRDYLNRKDRIPDSFWLVLPKRYLKRLICNQLGATDCTLAYNRYSGMTKSFSPLEKEEQFRQPIRRIGELGR